MGSSIFGEENAQLHEVVTQQLTDKNQRIALIEGATTGGILSQWMSESEASQDRLSSSILFASEVALLAAHQTDQVTWRDFCVRQAEVLLQSGTVDYVLISSPSQNHVDEQGVASKLGQVIFVAAGVEVERDVRMAGNLAIFRHRAARTALNLLRLHLLGESISS